jgi:hypothetical protein
MAVENRYTNQHQKNAHDKYINYNDDVDSDGVARVTTVTCRVGHKYTRQ